ncbi:MAG: hypothetical protein J5441_06470 [Clostridia bacterium]|nr:hypothetical protein [Clostridia bacterium]
MLKKLIKHEFISSWKTMLPLYAAMLVASGAGRLLNVFGGSSEAMVMQTVINVVRILNELVIALGIFLTLYVVAQRVYRSMLGDEGATTMAIPATVREHLTARFTTAMVWCACTMGVSVFSYWLYHAELPPVVSVFFNSGFGFFYNFMAALLALLIASVIVAGIYLASAIGHLFLKQRLAATIIGGIIIICTLGGISYLMFEFGVFDKIFAFIGEGTVKTMSDYGLFAAVFFSALCVGCFESANSIINRKLNIL